MAVECTPSQLVELAKCFTGFNPVQQNAVATYLLCQIANNGGGGGGSITVEDGGVPVVASATTLNFIGATVTDAGGGVADITVSGFITGMIMMWSGTIATIPTGWALCNGASGTPDLRNRFVVAANVDSAGQAMTNMTGPATKSGGSLTHNHNLDSFISAMEDNIDAGLDEAESFTGTPVSVFGINSVGDISYPQTATAAAPQPYFALAYIMKL